jgi:hypothetical protein
VKRFFDKYGVCGTLATFFPLLLANCPVSLDAGFAIAHQSGNEKGKALLQRRIHEITQNFQLSCIHHLPERRFTAPLY